MILKYITGLPLFLFSMEKYTFWSYVTFKYYIKHSKYAVFRRSFSVGFDQCVQINYKASYFQCDGLTDNYRVFLVLQIINK